MTVIDEKTLFNAGDEEVWHAIDDEHLERFGRRVEDMVRLLTELKAPKLIAERVFAELDRESAMMNRLLAQIRTFNESEKPKPPFAVADVNMLMPPDFFDTASSLDALIAVVKPPLWPLATNAINQALTLIELERIKCKARLAARLEDAQTRPTKQPSSHA